MPATAVIGNPLSAPRRRLICGKYICGNLEKIEELSSHVLAKFVMDVGNFEIDVLLCPSRAEVDEFAAFFWGRGRERATKNLPLVTHPSNPHAVIGLQSSEGRREENREHCFDRCRVRSLSLKTN